MMMMMMMMMKEISVPDCKVGCIKKAVYCSKLIFLISKKLNSWTHDTVFANALL